MGRVWQVSETKTRSLLCRYHNTHFAIAKWKTELSVTQANVVKAIEGITLQAPVDVSVFPENSARRFVADDGTIHIEHAELDWARLG